MNDLLTAVGLVSAALGLLLLINWLTAKADRRRR